MLVLLKKEMHSRKVTCNKRYEDDCSFAVCLYERLLLVNMYLSQSLSVLVLFSWPSRLVCWTSYIHVAAQGHSCKNRFCNTAALLPA